MSRSVLTWSARAATVAILLAAGCEERGTVRFEALGLATGDAPLSCNQDLVIRFSQPLADEVLPRRAVRVEDGGGRLVEVSLKARGNQLIVSPASPLGWAGAEGRITVHIPYPSAGRVLRSAAGEALGGPFTAAVSVLDAYVRLPGHLEITYCNLPDHAEGVPPSTEAGLPFPIELHFNAPLDPESLRTGIQVVDLERGEALPGAEVLLDPLAPERVTIIPFAGTDGWFAGGALYEVRVTAGLRSIDGRTPLADDARRFRTRPGQHGLIQVDFRDEDSLDPSSAIAPDPDGILRPKPLREAVALAEESDGTTTEIFAARPARAQILVPEALVQRLRGRFVIEALHFECGEPLPAGLQAEGLTLAIGYLPYEAGGALGTDFIENQNAVPRPVLASSGSATLASRKDDPRWLTLRLDEPFVYDGSGRALVVDLALPLGIHLGGIPAAIPICGLRDAGPAPLRPAMLLGDPGDVTGRPSGFRPRLVLQTMRHPTVVTRWYPVAAAVGQPVFHRDPRVDIRARGRESHDFTFYFEAGTPAPAADGGTVFLGSGALTTVVGSLGSCRALRVHIEFDPRPRTEGEEPAEIEYLLIHYRDKDR